MSYPTANPIVTADDSVVNLAVTPDIKSVQSGAWSSGSTWDLGRVPAVGETIGIDSAHTVTYSNNNTTAYRAIGIAGKLQFDATVNTKLCVQHLLVYGTTTNTTEVGELQIGTPGTPVDTSKTAQIVISDVALQVGTLSSLGIDPKQYGNGLLVWGKLTIWGKTVAHPYVRLANSQAGVAAAGNTSLLLASSVTGDWSAGDELVLPDCRQLSPPGGENFSGLQLKWDSPTISSISGGTTINLASALAYNHYPARRRRWILDATNASPIVVSTPSTSPHNFETGDEVSVYFATGNTAANGVWTITKIDEQHFSLDGSTGSGTFTGGTFGGRAIAERILKQPHALNMTRNVIIQSENGAGVRGHCICFHRAEIDVNYCRFKQLGRTTANDISSTNINLAITGASNASPIEIHTASTINRLATGQTVKIASVGGNTAANGTFTITKLDSDQTHFTLDGSTGNGSYTSGGTLTDIGENQKGRYAVHFHHVIGPTSIPGHGYQARFRGNVIDDPLPAAPSSDLSASKWGLTVHGTHYCLFQNNIIHHFAGANFQTEDGSESYNVFDGLFSSTAIGHNSERLGTADSDPENNGRAGSGFMFNGRNNYLRNCIAAGCGGTYSGIISGNGFNFFTMPAGQSTVIPASQGADPDVDGVTLDMRDVPYLEFSNCEAYGVMSTGLTDWHRGTGGYTDPSVDPATVTGLYLWHCYEFAFFGYPMRSVTFDGPTVIGDPDRANSSDFSRAWTWGDYRNSGNTVKNFWFEGTYIGFMQTNMQVGGTYTIQDGTIAASGVNVHFQTPSTPGSGGPIYDHTTQITNVKQNQWGVTGGWVGIQMSYDINYGTNTNLRAKDIVLVTSYDQVVGADYQVYYYEQVSTQVVPLENSNSYSSLAACPEAGLTNAQGYVKYHNDASLKSPVGSLSDSEGCCIAGLIAPASSVDGSTLTKPISGLIRSLTARTPGKRKWRIKV